MKVKGLSIFDFAFCDMIRGGGAENSYFEIHSHSHPYKNPCVPGCLYQKSKDNGLFNITGQFNKSNNNLPKNWTFLKTLVKFYQKT